MPYTTSRSRQQTKTSFSSNKPICPKVDDEDIDEKIDIKLTTTKYTTTYHRSVLIPTVIAVLPNKKPRNEKRNKLNEQRNKRFMDKFKGSVNTSTSCDSQYQHDKFISFNIDKVSEDLNEVIDDLRHNICRSDLLSTSYSLHNSSNNTLLNEKRTKHKIKTSNSYNVSPN